MQRISLQDAAERLGVHYMTVYKYVRTGKLAAIKEGGEWTVDPRDVTALRRRPVRAPRARRPRADASSRLVSRLVAGDEPGAWAVVDGAMSSGAAPAEIYLDVLIPALRAVGDGWASGDLTVADEHRAAAVAQRLIGRLGPRFARRGRRRGVVIVGAPSGELHALPVSIVADLIRARGFDVIDLGANTPADSFVEAAQEADPSAIALCVTTGAYRAEAGRVVEALRDGGIDAPIGVGGAAITSRAQALRTGADAWTGRDAASAVEAIEGLAIAAS